MKAFWKSKTFWFNVLALIVAVAGAFGFAGFKPSPDVEQAGYVIVALINLLLRFLTKKPIGVPGLE